MRYLIGAIPSFSFLPMPILLPFILGLYSGWLNKSSWVFKSKWLFYHLKLVIITGLPVSFLDNACYESDL